MAVNVTRRRFTVDEYYRMGETGILAEDERVELIEGEIIEMTPPGPRHAGHSIRINQCFQRHFGDAVLVSVQNPLRLDRYSEPQPDVVVLRPRPDFYTTSHPTPADVLLAVEIADTSLRFDTMVKFPLYARHAIREVWILNLTRKIVTVGRDPAPAGYQSVEVYRRGDQIAPVAFPDVSIAVVDILD